ncbi:hypothetical protein ACOXXX_17575 [Thalassococcus sp. BH17M4-6]|uniref:hypothetical protein n=1 Tax=Thalassococcus sp. BH17M4-6 TaxID=3413148 RepID=UPI003BC9BB78
MMYSLLALAVILGSVFLVLANLRLVAHDTFQVLRDTARNASRSGQLLPNMAFAALWLLIFALCQV